MTEHDQQTAQGTGHNQPGRNQPGRNLPADNQPLSAGRTRRMSGPFGRWRTSDILITAAIGVVFGVVFIVADGLWDLTKPLFTWFPPAQALIYGLWLVPGVLAPYLTRKAGAGVLAELIGSLVELPAGLGGGGVLLLYGLTQGVAAEAGYAVFGYRMWRRINPFIAGATAGIAPAILDNLLYYRTWSFGWQVSYGIAAIISTAVVGGLVSLALHAALRSSGALPARRS
jgi:energy-coupling factor transport system substrate-specific component